VTTRLDHLTRRDWLRGAAIGIGATAGSMSGWLHTFAADTQPKRSKSIIVLWLNGGPATIDMWDLKPGHANGGPFKEIDTTVPGMMIGEHLPKLAKHGKEFALIRSMATKEGDHARATYLLRTGYLPQGAIQFPAVGAIVANELGSESSDLPNFVSIAPTRFATTLGGGFLGPKYDPLTIGDSTSTVDGLKVPDLTRLSGVTDATQNARLDLLTEMEKRFKIGHTNSVTDSLQAASARAVRLMRPEVAASFQLEDEKDKTRDAYGRGMFGQGCLLARRLVERGVTFVEVTLDGWDTHQNNFERVKELCGTLDTAFAALLADLQDRGLLESTLVVCQGEFGRTPKINGNTGRDHWPASWSVALAGGGLKTGQVIGKTTKDGLAVDEKPTSVPDLIATIAKAIGIDPKKQNISNVTRPIRIADPDAKPIEELL
jgi:hypothetical protein